MIYLNINENKRLKFSYSVSNAHPENIKGKFVLDFGDTELGFPIKIDDRKIVTEIKDLDKFLTEGVGRVKARLEIIISDTFIIPWNEVVVINGPIKMAVEEITIDKEEIDPVEKYIAEEVKTSTEESSIEDIKISTEESSLADSFKRLLSLSKKEIVETVKDEKQLDQEKILKNFLNISIEELIQ